MSGNLSKKLIEQLERLEIDVPTGEVTLKSDKLNQLHIASCHEYSNFAPYLPAGAATMRELAVLAADVRGCGCLTGQHGTRVIVEVAGAAPWVAGILEHDGVIRAAERLVARSGVKATSLRRTRFKIAAVLAELGNRRNVGDPTAVRVVGDLIARIEALDGKLSGRLDSKAAARLVEAIRNDASCGQTRFDENTILMRVVGQRGESNALVFSALELWEIAGDDNRVVLRVPMWAVPWLCVQGALHGHNAELGVLYPSDSEATIATAARLGLDRSFVVFSDALEAARLLER